VSNGNFVLCKSEIFALMHEQKVPRNGERARCRYELEKAVSQHPVRCLLGVVEQTAIRSIQKAKGVLLAYSDSQHGCPAIGLCGECNREG